MELSHYEPVPPQVHRIASQYKLKAEEERVHGSDNGTQRR